MSLGWKRFLTRFCKTATTVWPKEWQFQISLQKDMKHNSNNGQFNLNRGVVNQCSSSEVLFCHETPKMSENFKYGSKIFKKARKAAKATSCNFKGIRPCMDALDMPNQIPHMDWLVVKRISRLLNLVQRYKHSKLFQ